MPASFYGPIPGAAAAASSNPLSAVGNFFRAIGDATSNSQAMVDKTAAIKAGNIGPTVVETSSLKNHSSTIIAAPLGANEDPFGLKSINRLNIASPAALTERQNTDGVTLRQRNGTAISEYAGDKQIWTREEPPLLFPSNLTTTVQRFPFIGFWARKGAAGERCIFLPIPPGISFSDNMQYSAIDLGIIGSTIAKATTAAVNEGGFVSGAGGAIGAAAGTLMNKMRSANGAAVASLAAKTTGFDNVSNFIDFGSRQVVAPNTNTAFQNSTIRQFQFSFKMMPRDEKEAKTITEIVKRFRQNMYPMGNDLILTYPPIWNIHFYDGHKGSENTKLPGIYDCYLTGMSAVYNSSGNMFHEDGHPVETDVQLTFEETRALTLVDIEKLSEGRNS